MRIALAGAFGDKHRNGSKNIDGVEIVSIIGRTGKHGQVDIPLADAWAGSQAVLRKSEETGLSCMAGHKRRFNSSHQWVKNRIAMGNLTHQAMDVDKKMNAKNQPRSWTAPLLWRHPAYTIGIFQYMTGSKEIAELAVSLVAQDGWL